ncbi:MAG: glutaminyl-peptide cyclotransferase [Chitinophagales bacterium]
MNKISYPGTAIALIAAVIFVACNGSDTPPPPTENPDGPKSLGYSIGPVYPHDTSSFTEGLLIYKGDMYESTGDPNYSGKSRLMKVDLKSGNVVQSINLDKKYFAEGIVILNDTIYQLTYQEKVGFMYALKDFKKLKEFTFSANEGWGMTTDGKEIIASDGTSNLYYYQPGTFRLLRTQAVTEGGSLAYNLNELEYIDGYIYANQWQRPYILKIDPSSGAIVAKADLTDLWNRVRSKDPVADVPNGIAYDSATKKIYVTGKKWPELYEIELSK